MQWDVKSDAGAAPEGQRRSVVVVGQGRGMVRPGCNQRGDAIRQWPDKAEGAGLATGAL